MSLSDDYTVNIVKFLNEESKLIERIHCILFADFEQKLNDYKKGHKENAIKNLEPEFFTSFKERFTNTWIEFSSAMFIIPKGKLEADNHITKLNKLITIFNNPDEDLEEFEYNETIQNLLALQMENKLCLQQLQEALEN